MTEHVLDRPIWHALHTRQSDFSVAAPGAARFQDDVGPLAGARDDSGEALADLASLVPDDDMLGVFYFGSSPLRLPSTVCVERTAPGVQLILDTLRPAPGDARIVALGEEDAPDMLALATLAAPGPFRSRTHQLGSFWGIKENGRLLAMAGERLKPAGHVELSGVCTHPDARGRGYAAQLSHWVASQIRERGEQPFLHAYADNEGALRIYRTIGFTLRARMNLLMLRRA